MTPDDIRTARRIVDLWLDGISYHVSPADIERLHTIAAGVIAQERRSRVLDALRQLHDVAAENEREYPAYANATWDAIERVQEAAGIEELWPR